ncbi:MAG: lysoplasmalogenase [Promethearchaeota archaeon]
MNSNGYIIVFLVVLSLILALEIRFELQGDKKGVYIFKPMLMPVIAIFYVGYMGIYKSGLNQYASIFIIGLVFGFLGDIFLIESSSKKRFMMGLVAFLVGHLLYLITYILILSDISKTTHTINPLYLVFYVPMVLLLIFMIPKVVKSMGDMKIPGAVYAIVISFMHIVSTIFILYGITPFSFLLWSGSLSFLVSDFILAWNKFKSPIKLYKLWNMSTYVFGQYLMTLGMCFL